MLGLFDYWMYRLNPAKKNKLGMCILVKDEHDIIEDNIRYHAAAGIEAFVVTDNASTDGTRDILSKLSKEFDILIVDEPSTEFLQAQWTTDMAIKAKQEQQVDWLLCCDADEFWVPTKGKCLKDVFKGGASIINCERHNMVMPEEASGSGFDYMDTTLRVVNPVLFSKQSKAILSQSELSVSVAKVGDKVAVNTHGLVRVKAGNHNAKHWWKWSRVKTSDVEVYHYPFRSFKRFECQVKNIIGNIAGGKAELGQHAYRWKDLYEKGTLKEEYDRLTVSKNDENTLRKYGILADDDTARDLVKAARAS